MSQWGGGKTSKQLENWKNLRKIGKNWKILEKLEKPRKLKNCFIWGSWGEMGGGPKIRKRSRRSPTLSLGRPPGGVSKEHRTQHPNWEKQFSKTYAGYVPSKFMRQLQSNASTVPLAYCIFQVPSLCLWAIFGRLPKLLVRTVLSEGSAVLEVMEIVGGYNSRHDLINPDRPPTLRDFDLERDLELGRIQAHAESKSILVICSRNL